MTHYKDQILACDFFTVETLFLKTVYVFFFIERGSRRVHFAGCTTNRNDAWVTQQARQISWNLADADQSFRFLIRDRDKKLTEAFDAIFRSEGLKIIRTPKRAPNANSHAERYVRTVRSECLDKIIIVNQAHLCSVLTEYVTFYNARRPHQGIGQQSPIIRLPEEHEGSVQKRPVLGGIINDYYRLAA
jgi:putative transposase